VTNKVHERREMTYIAVEDIEQNVENLREVDREHEDWPDFVEDIRNNGILLPVAVKEIEPGRYVLDDGLHRYTAACEIGLKEVPCIIRPADDDRDTLLLQISANSQGVETKPAQYAAALKTILERDAKLTISELADKVNKSSGWLRKLLSLNNLTDKAGKLVDRGEISLSNAYVLAKLPVEEQGEWLEKAKQLEPGKFEPLAMARRRELNRKKRDEVSVTYRPRKKTEVIERFEALNADADSDDENVQAELRILRWVLGIDEVSDVDKVL